MIPVCNEASLLFRVLLAQPFGLVRPAGIAQALQIFFKIRMGVLGAALFHHCPHGIDGAGGFFHLFLLPVQDQPGPLGADFRMLLLYVPLLMGILPQVKQHLPVKQVVPVVDRADVQPMVKPR